MQKELQISGRHDRICGCATIRSFEHRWKHRCCLFQKRSKSHGRHWFGRSGCPRCPLFRCSTGGCHSVLGLRDHQKCSSVDPNHMCTWSFSKIDWHSCWKTCPGTRPTKRPRDGPSPVVCVTTKGPPPCTLLNVVRTKFLVNRVMSELGTNQLLF